MWRNLLKLLLLTAVPCQAATINFALTNFNLTSATNAIIVQPITTPTFHGTFLSAGLPIRIPTTNGLASRSLLAGNYEMRIVGITMRTNFLFAVPSGDATYDVTETGIWISGGNIFNYTPGVRRLEAGTGVTLSPTNGLGNPVTVSVDISSSAPFVRKAGDTMTGGLTNDSGFYYNGELLTNSAGSGGEATNVLQVVQGTNALIVTNGLERTVNALTDTNIVRILATNAAVGGPFVSRSGDTMTGGLTNNSTAGFRGNARGLTNIAVDGISTTNSGTAGQALFYLNANTGYWATATSSGEATNVLQVVAGTNTVVVTNSLERTVHSLTDTNMVRILATNTAVGGPFVGKFDSWSTNQTATNFTGYATASATNFFEITNREPYWRSAEGSLNRRWILQDPRTGPIMEIRDDNNPDKGIYFGDAITRNFWSWQAKGPEEGNTDPRMTMHFGEDYGYSFNSNRIRFGVNDAFGAYTLFSNDVSGNIFYGDVLVTTIQGSRIALTTNTAIYGNLTNIAGSLFLDNARGLYFKGFGTSTYRNGFSLDVDDNFQLGDANMAAVIVNAPVVQLTGASPGASQVLRTDANKNIAAVTIGSGLSFDGTTLTATGGGGSATNAVSAIQTNGSVLITSATNLNFTNFVVLPSASGGTATIDLSGNGIAMNAGTGTNSTVHSLTNAYGHINWRSITNPAGALTITEGAAGNVTGDLTYSVSFYTTNGETLATNLGTFPEAVGSIMTISNIPTGLSPWVIGRKLYRTPQVGGGSKLVTNIADNTTIVVADNVADGSLGEFASANNTTAGLIYRDGILYGLLSGADPTGSDNTFLGHRAGESIRHPSASSSTFIGAHAGEEAVSSAENTYVGARAGRMGLGASANVAIGTDALRDNTNGSQNAVFGKDAFITSTNTVRTVVGGHGAGDGMWTSVDSVLLGANTMQQRGHLYRTYLIGNVGSNTTYTVGSSNAIGLGYGVILTNDHFIIGSAASPITNSILGQGNAVVRSNFYWGSVVGVRLTDDGTGVFYNVDANTLNISSGDVQASTEGLFGTKGVSEDPWVFLSFTNSAAEPTSDITIRLVTQAKVAELRFDATDLISSTNIQVPNEAYDATGWNGDLTVPTKDAIRDKIEAGVAASFTVKTNGVDLSAAATSINFVNSGNTTVTGAVSGAAVTLGISSTGGGSATFWTNTTTIFASPTSTSNGIKGVIEAPYAISNAFQSASVGDTIVLLPGIYNVTNRLTNAVGGTVINLGGIVNWWNQGVTNGDPECCFVLKDNVALYNLVVSNKNPSHGTSVGIRHVDGDDAATNWSIVGMRSWGDSDVFMFNHTNVCSGIISDSYAASRWDAFVSIGALHDITLKNVNIYVNGLGFTNGGSKQRTGPIVVLGGDIKVEDCTIEGLNGIANETYGINTQTGLGSVVGSRVRVNNSRIYATNAVAIDTHPVVLLNCQTNGVSITTSNAVFTKDVAISGDVSIAGDLFDVGTIENLGDMTNLGAIYIGNAEPIPIILGADGSGTFQGAVTAGGGSITLNLNGSASFAGAAVGIDADGNVNINGQQTNNALAGTGFRYVQVDEFGAFRAVNDTNILAGDGSSLTNQDATITLVVDGGGSTITTGAKGVVRIPRNMSVTGWDIVADQSGSCVVDVWYDSYANFPPTVADTIAGSEKPTLSAAIKNQDTNLSAWTDTTLTSGDYIKWNVDSASTVTHITVTLYGKSL